MTVGTIILDEHDNYVYASGQLPIRPLWDKELLSAMIEFGTVSEGGYKLLPDSLRSLSSKTHGEPQTPITIQEINYLSDILIVVRGRSRDFEGKKFRFDRFDRILATGQIEIWRRNDIHQK